MVTSVKTIGMSDVNTIDKSIIHKQLKRLPRGLKGIVSRCAFGCPQVVETDVFIEGHEPFPTLYWLTCPMKIKAISRLEGEGWSERLLETLAGDEVLRERFLAAQEDYKERRRQGAGQHSYHPVFETGVGGVQYMHAIKCLHAHYAHYLAGGNNPIGEIVDKEISGLECRQRCDRA